MKTFLIAAQILAVALCGTAFAQNTEGGKPVGAGILAEQLREGVVSPGDKYDLEVGSRFHRVHTKFMAIGCQSCHAGVKFPENVQFLRREEFPLVAYPGAVDRSNCLGCHKGEGALATPFYGVPKK